MCVASLRMQIQARVHMLALRNPMLIVLNPFPLIFSSDYHFNAIFIILQALPTFLGRGSTNYVASWY